MFQALTDLWIEIQSQLQEVVQPLIHDLGLTEFYDDVPAGLELLTMGVLQIAIILLVFRPLEAFAPAQRWENRKLVRVDVVYTLLNKLGIIPLAIFMILLPLNDELIEFTRTVGFVLPTVEQVIPWLRDKPLVLFVVYFLLYDFAGYLWHRAQHALPWLWALHSLHHSQRQVSTWTDDRNHVLDDLLFDLYLAVVAILIGVQPGQYIAILMLGRLIEAFSHVNTRFRFGRIVDKVLVDPMFHRTHHARANPSEPHIHDTNFSAVFPIWDIVFRTAHYDYKQRDSGLDDPDADRDNDKGFIGQQIAGLARLGRAIRRTFSSRAPRPTPAE
jgi:sterol desaturase/sphingolipid hydroxylase (fatty acid hydroxylase superfamily)